MAARKEQEMQVMASMRAKNYLERFFKELKVDFKYLSRQEIEESFKHAKDLKPESLLFT